MFAIRLSRPDLPEGPFEASPRVCARGLSGNGMLAETVTGGFSETAGSDLAGGSPGTAWRPGFQQTMV